MITLLLCHKLPQDQNPLHAQPKTQQEENHLFNGLFKGFNIV